MKLAFIRYKPSIFRYKEVRGHLAIFSVKYRIYFQTKMGPCPMQLVVLSAVNAAVSMLTDLSSDKYLSLDENVAFLKHSTGHHPAGSEIDASIIYADYYYIEALLRLYAMKQ